MFERISLKKFRIKSISDCRYSFGPIKQLEEMEITYYDILGKQTIESSFTSGGIRMFTKIFAYDEQGLEIFELHVNEDGGVESEITVENSEDRKTCTKTICDVNGDIEYIEVYDFDEKRNLLNYYSYHQYGEIYFKVCNNYDNSNRLIESRKYDCHDLCEHKKKYEYDSKGYLRIATILDRNDLLETKFIFKYNSKSENIEKIELNAKGKIMGTARYKYNDKGLLISKAEYNDVMEIKYLFEYGYEYY
jgi:hypothetical protein